MLYWLIYLPTESHTFLWQLVLFLLYLYKDFPEPQFRALRMVGCTNELHPFLDAYFYIIGYFYIIQNTFT